MWEEIQKMTDEEREAYIKEFEEKRRQKQIGNAANTTGR